MINIEGHVLEDRVFQLIRHQFASQNVNARQVYERLGAPEHERVEIDVWLKYGRSYFVFEIKNSAYDWVFLKGPNTPQHFHRLHDGCNDLHTRAYHAMCQHPYAIVTEAAFEVLVEPGSSGTRLKTQNGKLAHPGFELPERPTGREIVRPAVKQILKNIETLAYHEMQRGKNTNSRPPLDHIFLPIVVTNAKLYAAEYEAEHVNDKANLTSLASLEEKPWLVFNHSEILYWGLKGQQVVQHLGFQPDASLGQPSYEGSHVRSIFVVQHQQLKNFLSMLQGK